mgnify:CR=1 FL=1
MFGAVAKTYYAQLLDVAPERLFVISIMPCIAKKQEAALPTMQDAGVGPDVSIDATSPMEMAIRGAIMPLNHHDTFEEVMARFSDAARTPLTLYGTTYAVPVSQGFSMMFIRNDILTELGLEIPENLRADRKVFSRADKSDE